MCVHMYLEWHIFQDIGKKHLGNLLFLLIYFYIYFLERFWGHSTIEGKIQRFLYTFCSHTCIASPIINRGIYFELSVSWCWCLAGWQHGFQTTIYFHSPEETFAQHCCRHWRSIRQMPCPQRIHIFPCTPKTYTITQGLPTFIYNMFLTIHTNARCMKFKNRFVLFKERALFPEG